MSQDVQKLLERDPETLSYKELRLVEQFYRDTIDHANRRLSEVIGLLNVKSRHAFLAGKIQVTDHGTCLEFHCPNCGRTNWGPPGKNLQCINCRIDWTEAQTIKEH